MSCAERPISSPNEKLNNMIYRPFSVDLFCDAHCKRTPHDPGIALRPETLSGERHIGFNGVVILRA